MKILFVLKKRDISTGSGLSSGLINSAKLVQEMLLENNVECHIVEVDDNNCIDREVAQYKPTHVIIEALWVVPSKFIELKKVHSTVKWIIRLHSEIPFLANEGVALQWINEYLDLDLTVAVNSPRIKSYLEQYVHLKDKKHGEIVLLPNYYKIKDLKIDTKKIEEKSEYLNISCFGAIRPLKNQLIQAMAAIFYCKKNHKKLNFHINVGRIENSGSNNVLKNIRALFEGLPADKYKLVEHYWYDHKDFIEIVKTMDLNLQVSLTETFNIVTADFVANSIPVVVSHEIKWVDGKFRANPNDLDDIVHKMKEAFLNKKNGAKSNIKHLIFYNKESETKWLKYFKKKD